jgi:hypothetical protein
VPPFVGVAVNVTAVPEQIVVVWAAMLSAGLTVLPTTIVIVLEVAVVGLAHDAVEVSTHVTVAPLVKPAVVNALLSVPAFTLFTFHW